MRAIMLAHDASLHLSRQRSAAVRHQLAWTTTLWAETYSQCALKHHAATLDDDHEQMECLSKIPIAKTLHSSCQVCEVDGIYGGR